MSNNNQTEKNTQNENPALKVKSQDIPIKYEISQFEDKKKDNKK